MNRIDSVMGLLALLVLYVLVPEGVGQEVEAGSSRAALKESSCLGQTMSILWERELRGWGRRGLIQRGRWLCK